MIKEMKQEINLMIVGVVEMLKDVLLIAFLVGGTAYVLFNFLIITSN